MIWLHRTAVLLVCLTWPLIWLGGLVTTTDAGMAVPDWPGTYGYNLFLYPWKKWLLGPFDLLIEHGHRLLGALVGLVSIIAVILAWLKETRRWVIVLSIVTLGGVLIQGVLGGSRVLWDARTLAMIHGCLGQLILLLGTGLAGVTGRHWQVVDRSPSTTPNESQSKRLNIGRSRVLVSGLTCLIFLQIIVGAQLRHILPDAPPAYYRHLLWVHLGLALTLWLVTFGTWYQLRGCGDLTLTKPAVALVGLIVVQVGLGVFTWVLNYGWPWIFQGWSTAARYVIESGGWWGAFITTFHQATGALLLATSGMLWLRVERNRWRKR